MTIYNVAEAFAESKRLMELAEDCFLMASAINEAASTGKETIIHFGENDYDLFELDKYTAIQFDPSMDVWIKPAV